MVSARLLHIAACTALRNLASCPNTEAEEVYGQQQERHRKPGEDSILLGARELLHRGRCRGRRYSGHCITARFWPLGDTKHFRVTAPMSCVQPAKGTVPTREDKQGCTRNESHGYCITLFSFPLRSMTSSIRPMSKLIGSGTRGP